MYFWKISLLCYNVYIQCHIFIQFLHRNILIATPFACVIKVMTPIRYHGYTSVFNPRASNGILHPYTGNGGGVNYPQSIPSYDARERLKISTCGKNCLVWDIFMVALWNRADHYIFILFLLLLSSSFFFFSSPNLSSRRVDVYHTSAHGVVLV